VIPGLHTRRPGEDGIDFNLAFIPPTLKIEHKKDFDATYMRPLFNLGYSMAAGGRPWQKDMPGFHTHITQPDLTDG
jgi:hypothetical protein